LAVCCGRLAGWLDITDWLAIADWLAVLSVVAGYSGTV
jgi:hypothetical protein